MDCFGASGMKQGTLAREMCMYITNENIKFADRYSIVLAASVHAYFFHLIDDSMWTRHTFLIYAVPGNILVKT